MQLRDVTQSLITALIGYKGEKTGQLKKKEEVARILLLSTVKASVHIYDNKSVSLQEQMILYQLLYIAQKKLQELKNNREGELDSIIRAHIKILKEKQPYLEH